MKAVKGLILAFVMCLGMPAWAVEAEPVESAATEQVAEVSGKINLNTADASQLQVIKGIGPKTAEAIISFRDDQGPFSSVDQLLAIKGIGEKKLAKMRDQLTVQ